MCAMQQIYLHGEGDQATAIKTLGELLSGPLCEEAADSLKLVGGVSGDHHVGLLSVALPIIEQLRREFPHLVRAASKGEVAPVSPSAMLPSGGVAEQVPWPWPQWHQVAIGTLICVSIGTGLQVCRVHEETVAHVEGYRLRFEPGVDESGTLEVQATESGMPDRVLLCRSASCEQPDGEIMLSGNRGKRKVKRDTIDTFYHVRIGLSRRNVAYSLEEKVPKYILTNGPGQSVNKLSSSQINKSSEEVKDSAAKSDAIDSHNTEQISLSQQIRISSGKMIYIPGGSFIMGSNDLPNEKTPRTVKMKGYSLEETEVTVAAYTTCVNAGRCTAPQFSGVKCNYGNPMKALHPINCVDWHQANNYCGVIGRRLPTEKEWEYAAKGKQQRKYSWGNGEPGLNQLCWQREDGTCPVGIPKSDQIPEGVYGMEGNVSEWVSDNYAECHDPTCSIKEDGTVRGGSYPNINAWELRVTRRTNFPKHSKSDDLGFRCAADGKRVMDFFEF